MVGRRGDTGCVQDDQTHHLTLHSKGLAREEQEERAKPSATRGRK